MRFENYAPSPSSADVSLRPFALQGIALRVLAPSASLRPKKCFALLNPCRLGHFARRSAYERQGAEKMQAFFLNQKTLESGPPFALIYKMWQVGRGTLLDRFARNQEKAFGFRRSGDSDSDPFITEDCPFSTKTGSATVYPCPPGPWEHKVLASQRRTLRCRSIKTGFPRLFVSAIIQKRIFGTAAG